MQEVYEPKINPTMKYEVQLLAQAIIVKLFDAPLAIRSIDWRYHTARNFQWKDSPST